MRNDISFPGKSLTFFVVTAIGLSTTGCIGYGKQGVDALSSSSIPLPAGVVAAALPDDGGKGLRACAKVTKKGSKESAACQEMEIVGDLARITVHGLEKDQDYIVQIEFSFHSKVHGDVILATTERALSSTAGVNRLTVARDEYLYPDDDKDGWSNLRELERGTSPRLADKLVKTSQISAGNMGCSLGGVWVESGIDANANGILELSEVKDSRSVCHGSSDPRFRVKIEAVYPGANCPNGGLLVLSGVDADSSDTLEPDEVSRSRFICDGGLGWQGAMLIRSGDSGNALEAQVALGSDGSAVVVWQQKEGGYYQIWARRYLPDAGWGEAVRLGNGGGGDAFSPQVAMDAAGNALVVWQQSDGVWESIWSARFVSGKGWESASLIEDNSLGDGIAPRLAMNDAGEAVVVWRQNMGEGIEQVWANRFIPSTGWGVATRIDGVTGEDGWSPDVAMDHRGNAVAVWVSWYNGSLKTWANHFSPESGWAAAQRIGPDVPERADYPRVAMDSDGRATVVWEQKGDTWYHIWVNRFTPASGWGSARRIETETAGNASGPQVAMDESGNAIVVWLQSGGSGNGIWSSRFEAANGWGEARRIVSNSAGTALAPRVAMERGSAVVAWIQSSDRGEIWATRFAPQRGWGSAEWISPGDAGSAWHPELAMDEYGEVMVVWHQGSDERGSIWSNRFLVR